VYNDVHALNIEHCFAKFTAADKKVLWMKPEIIQILKLHGNSWKK
jgi:hypothetical protein